jgi:hypothetical protein
MPSLGSVGALVHSELAEAVPPKSESTTAAQLAAKNNVRQAIFSVV